MTQVSNFLLVAGLAGIAYLTIACLRVMFFGLRRPDYVHAHLPSFTVLKPVAGDEPKLFDNLASFCKQDYGGRYEVIFCLHDAADSARPVIERVIERFPWCRTSLAVGDNHLMRNPKIANIAKPGVELNRQIVVIADSDIGVEPRYLRSLAAAFDDERVGAVTCLYAGAPSRALVSRLGALAVTDGFAPSVLVATAIGKLRFCLGATMAVRCDVLESVGGLAALGQQLADDHRLGELVDRAGFRVALSRCVVKTTVPETKLGELWTHELRWARTNMSLAPAGYAFSFLMYALPLSLIYLAVSRNIVYGLPLVCVAAFLRLALHFLARSAFGVRGDDDAWLIPARDFISLAIWATSLFGRTVRWRERLYRVNE